MGYSYVFTPTAQRDLEKLERQYALAILKKLKVFIALENPLVRAKKLKWFDTDTYRFRVGDYRVVFRTDTETGYLVVLVILKIAHRKDVYK